MNSTELADLYQSLSDQTAIVNARLRQYRQLFLVNAETRRLLELTAEAFFQNVRYSLLESALIRVRRLTDYSSFGKNGRPNASLAKFVEEIRCTVGYDAARVDEIDDRLQKLAAKLTPFTNYVSRGLAHADLQTIQESALSVNVSALNEVVDEINYLVGMMGTLLGREPIAYTSPTERGSACDLVARLRQ